MEEPKKERAENGWAEGGEKIQVEGRGLGGPSKSKTHMAGPLQSPPPPGVPSSPFPRLGDYHRLGHP